jgi:uncharacterized protein YwqG
MGNNDSPALESLIARYRLQDVAAEIMSQARPCVTLVAGETDDYSVSCGSRIGGAPSLPDAASWPRSRKLYLNFIMQINLGEVLHPLPSYFPATGLLQFFVEEDESCTDVKFRIFYFDTTAGFEPVAEVPGDFAHEYYVDLVPHRLEFLQGFSIPGYGSELYELVQSRLGNEAADRFYELTREAAGLEISGEKEVVGQLSGYPSYANGDIAENAYLVKNDKREMLYAYDQRKARAPEIRKGAMAYELFWRIDSCQRAELEIWDFGSFNVLMKRKDIENLNFTEAYVELESS